MYTLPWVVTKVQTVRGGARENAEVFLDRLADRFESFESSGVWT
jgi:hypothetical protein